MKAGSLLGGIYEVSLGHNPQMEGYPTLMPYNAEVGRNWPYTKK
ncbi:MAG: hypothetical protein PWP04_867 [Candidatus Atribacteria bacterium]|nr:hypothetical protein [Candidatus Atribacteria bacterium]